MMNPNSLLLAWFQENKRDLPFRTKPSAYKIWVSEVMLQQTRVAAMLPIYDQFLLRFPDMESLAEAPEEEVLAFWRGLGYYSRARNLRKACAYVISNFNGRFPEQLQEALAIPGVGPYTARAVLSMAYGKSYAVLDGNVKRVISRLFAESDEKKWQYLADQFLNREKPGDHNQAMMELGALVCLPRPNCSSCPISLHCKAHLTGDVGKYPPAKKEVSKLSIDLHFYILEQGGRILLTREKDRRFFKGIYSLPYLIEPTDPEERLPVGYSNPRYLQDSLGELQSIPLEGMAKHSITHHKIRVFLHKARRNMESHHKFHSAGDEIWTDWENLERDFPSSIAKKILKFPGIGGLFSQ